MVPLESVPLPRAWLLPSVSSTLPGNACRAVELAEKCDSPTDAVAPDPTVWTPRPLRENVLRMTETIVCSPLPGANTIIPVPELAKVESLITTLVRLKPAWFSAATPVVLYAKVEPWMVALPASVTHTPTVASRKVVPFTAALAPTTLRPNCGTATTESSRTSDACVLTRMPLNVELPLSALFPTATLRMRTCTPLPLISMARLFTPSAT